MRLSKSLYTRGLQCVKSLWLKKYHKDILTPPDSSTEAIFATGNLVGDLACELFPKGKEIPHGDITFQEKIALTKQWMIKDKEEVARRREALLRYCELDTLAMVKVLDICDNCESEFVFLINIDEIKYEICDEIIKFKGES